MSPRTWIAPCVALIVTSACGTREQGMTLNLSVTRQRTTATIDGDGWHFTRANGDAVTLSRAFVTLSALEITECPSVARKAWRLLAPISTAHAHSTASPTRMGAPHVQALGDESTVSEVDALAPPPGSYCQMTAIFGPADADAEDLPEGFDMVGKSFFAEGTVTPTGGSPVTFALESTGEHDVQLALANLTLDQAHPTRELSVRLWPERWLDGVDLGDPAEAGHTAFHNMLDSIDLAP